MCTDLLISSYGMLTFRPCPRTNQGHVPAGMSKRLHFCSSSREKLSCWLWFIFFLVFISPFTVPYLPWWDEPFFSTSMSARGYISIVSTPSLHITTSFGRTEFRSISNRTMGVRNDANASAVVTGKFFGSVVDNHFLLSDSNRAHFMTFLVVSGSNKCLIITK